MAKSYLSNGTQSATVFCRWLQELSVDCLMDVPPVFWFIYFLGFTSPKDVQKAVSLSLHNWSTDGEHLGIHKPRLYMLQGLLGMPGDHTFKAGFLLHMTVQLS